MQEQQARCFEPCERCPNRERCAKANRCELVSARRRLRMTPALVLAMVLAHGLDAQGEPEGVDACAAE